MFLDEEYDFRTVIILPVKLIMRVEKARGQLPATPLEWWAKRNCDLSTTQATVLVCIQTVQLVASDISISVGCNERLDFGRIKYGVPSKETWKGQQRISPIVNVAQHFRVDEKFEHRYSCFVVSSALPVRLPERPYAVLYASVMITDCISCCLKQTRIARHTCDSEQRLSNPIMIA
jgi:hypothetical protein